MLQSLKPSDFQIHGLLAHRWRGRQSSLTTFHRHNEVELNLLARGSRSYTIAGRTVSIRPRTMCLFWGGFPHRIAVWKNGDIWSLSIPLTVFLSWPLSRETFVYPLLHGELLYEADPSRWRHDQELMRRWHADLGAGATFEQQEVLLLEVQARLRRLAMESGHIRAVSEHGVEPARVAKMLQFIAEHYAETGLTVREIAQAAQTNPSYAMESFKESCGVSMMRYVNDQRVAHARRLLATTDAKILDVAMAAGFGSLSQFHNVFIRVCSQTPREYARAHRPWPSDNRHRPTE